MLFDIRCDIDLKVVVYLLTSALWSNRYVIGPKETIMEHSKKKIAILITFSWRSPVKSSMIAVNEFLDVGFETAFCGHEELSLLLLPRCESVFSNNMWSNNLKLITISGF